jgi:hypothetical protein
MDSPHLFYSTKGERAKLPTWVQLRPDHQVRGKKVYYRSFAAGVRKLTRLETKMKRKKKVKEAFTDLMLCETS